MCKQILPNILKQSQNTLVTFLHGSPFYFGYFTTKGSERQNGFLPVFETRYRYALFPSSLTRGRTGQRNEGVEFRRKPQTPQAESLRPEEGRGLPCAPGTGVTPGQEANPGAGARSHPQTPPKRPTPPRNVEAPARPPQAKGGGNRAPPSPPYPPKPGHTEGRGLGAAAAGPPSPTLPGSYRPGDGHGRPELGLAGGERRDSRPGGAGAALPGRRAQGLARASRAPHPASAPAPPVIRGERLSAAVAGSGQSFAPPDGAAAARAGAVHSPRSAT